MEHNMLFNEMPTLITNIWKIMIKKESSYHMCWDMNYFPFFTKNDEDQKEQKACVQCEWAERIRYTLKNFKKKKFSHGLLLQKVHRTIKFNQKYCLRPPYIRVNVELKQMLKRTLKKIFSNSWIIRFLEKPCIM